MFSVFIIKNNVVAFMYLNGRIKTIQEKISFWLYRNDILGYKIEQFNNEGIWHIENNITIQIEKDINLI